MIGSDLPMVRAVSTDGKLCRKSGISIIIPMLHSWTSSKRQRTITFNMTITILKFFSGTSASGIYDFRLRETRILNASYIANSFRLQPQNQTKKHKIQSKDLVYFWQEIIRKKFTLVLKY